MITDHQSIERTTVSFMKRMGVELDATTPFIELDNYYQALLYHFLRERFYLEKPHASKYWFTTQYFIDHIHSTLVPFIKECENETTVLTHPWLYKNFIVTQPTIIVQAPVGMGGDFLATLIHNHVYDHKQISFGEGGKCISDFDTLELDIVEQDHFWQIDNAYEHAEEIKTQVKRAVGDKHNIFLTALHLDITPTLRYFEDVKVVKIVPKVSQDLNTANINSLIKNYYNKIDIGVKHSWSKLSRWEVSTPDADKSELEQILENNFNYAGGYLNYLGLNYIDIIPPSINENWWDIYNVFYSDLYSEPKTKLGGIMKKEVLYGILNFLGLQPKDNVVQLLDTYVMHKKL